MSSRNIFQVRVNFGFFHTVSNLLHGRQFLFMEKMFWKLVSIANCSFLRHVQFFRVNVSSKDRKTTKKNNDGIKKCFMYALCLLSLHYNLLTMAWTFFRLSKEKNYQFGKFMLNLNFPQCWVGRNCKKKIISVRCCGKSFAVFPEVFTIILFDTSLLQSDVQNLR